MWAFLCLKIILSFSQEMRDMFTLWMNYILSFLRKTTKQAWEGLWRKALRWELWLLTVNIICGKISTNYLVTISISMLNKKDSMHNWTIHKDFLESIHVNLPVNQLYLVFLDLKTINNNNNSSKLLNQRNILKSSKTSNTGKLLNNKTSLKQDQTIRLVKLTYVLGKLCSFKA